jgi:hypothetical protein
MPWRFIGWATAAFLLLLPLVAMQFTDEVNWDAFDFVFMGILFGSVGLGLELAFCKTGDVTYRVAVAAALAAGFLLLWINAAVGIIGDDDDPNILYTGVVAVALAGTIIGRFRPAGMARAMIAAALVQVSVPAIAWAIVPDARAAVWSPEVPVLTGFFAALWLLSAALFRKVARRQSPATS